MTPLGGSVGLPCAYSATTAGSSLLSTSFGPSPNGIGCGPLPAPSASPGGASETASLKGSTTSGASVGSSGSGSSGPAGGHTNGGPHGLLGGGGGGSGVGSMGNGGGNVGGASIGMIGIAGPHGSGGVVGGGSVVGSMGFFGSTPPHHGMASGLPQAPRQKGRPRKRKPKDIEAMTSNLGEWSLRLRALNVSIGFITFYFEYVRDHRYANRSDRTSMVIIMLCTCWTVNDPTMTQHKIRASTDHQSQITVIFQLNSVL